MRKLCGVCGRHDKFVYHVPDDIWERVVPSVLKNRVVCLVCFDDLAAMRRVNFAQHLSGRPRFWGDDASIEFESPRAHSYDFNSEVSLPGTRGVFNPLA